MNIHDIKPTLAQQFLSNRAWFKRVPRTVTEIANKFDVAPNKVVDTLDSLELQGTSFDVRADGTVAIREIVEKSPPAVVLTSSFRGKWIRFGAVGDNHMCSKYERLDILATLYEAFRREGITQVYNTGNFIDGEARFNYNDIHTYGMDNQINYFLKHYPRVKGLTTSFVTGDDHESWYSSKTGVNIGRHVIALAHENEYLDCLRTDLVYLSHMEGDIIFQNDFGKTAMLRVMHAGGGSAYAISYTVQKIVETFQSGEKPDLLLVGHYHKMEYSRPRNVRVWQTGCTQDQTPFMRKKKLDAHLGGWIIEAFQSDDGTIAACKTQDFQFFDRKFYAGVAVPEKFSSTVKPLEVKKGNKSVAA